MKCAVYVSREKIAFDEQSLAELARSAAECNANVGITGYLYYDKGHFTQYIEGETNAIDVLLAALNRDSRHSILAAYESVVDSCRFADWHMKQISRNELIEIQLEHVLKDYLLCVSRIPATNVQDPQPLWRMVDTLARFQNQLSGETH